MRYDQHSQRERPKGTEVERKGTTPLIVERCEDYDNKGYDFFVVWTHDGFRNWEGVEFPSSAEANAYASGEACDWNDWIAETEDS